MKFLLAVSFCLPYIISFARFSACSCVSATMWFFSTVSFALYFSVYNRTAETHVYPHVYEGFCGEFWNLDKQLLNFIRETFACVNIFLNHFLFIYCLFIYCIFICYVKLVVVINCFCLLFLSTGFMCFYFCFHLCLHKGSKINFCLCSLQYL